MITNLISKFSFLMNGVTILPDNSRESLETYVHEVGHLLFLFGSKKTKDILLFSLKNNVKVQVNKSIKEKLKTIKGQDNNEIKTTAVTILATEQLGGGTFQESIRSMLGNLQAVDSKVKNEFYINQCIKLMMSKKMQGHANVLAKMLLELEKDLQPT